MSLNVQIKLHSNALRLQAALQIPAIGVTAFFGPSGCGKTTLLRLIAGLETPAINNKNSSVLLQFNEQEWSEKVPPWSRQVGYVTQQSTLFPHMTVAQNLMFAWKRATRPNPDFEPRAVMKQTGIQELSARYPEQLSGGQQQRVALARALCSCPRLLLLDEPLANLDGSARTSLLELLKKVKAMGIPIIYVSHQMDEVCVIADYLAVFKAESESTEVVAGELEQMVPHLKPETLIPVWVEQQGKRVRVLMPYAESDALGLKLARGNQTLFAD